MSKESFCPLPWMHLATHPIGHVSLCCRSEFKDQLSVAKSPETDLPLELGKDCLDDILNCDRFREVRQAMLSDERHPACQGCYDVEDRGSESKRLTELDRFHFFKEDAKKITDPSGRVPMQYRFVELRLGNTCNLKCVSCNPMSSSRWIRDFQQLKASGFDPYGDYTYISGEFTWPENEEFWSDLSTQTDQIEKIYINGGEPTLIKKHWEFLETLIRMGRAKEIDLVYSINLTPLPKRAIEIWDQFQSVELNLSIDDLFERNDYIRYPSRWSDTVQVMQDLDQTRYKKIVLQTLSLYNLYHVDDFYLYFKKEFPNFIVSYNVVQHPRFLSPFVLSEEKRKAVLERANKVMPRMQAEKLKAALSGPQIEEPELWPQFRQYLFALDQIRNTDFREVFAETSRFYQI